MSLSKHQIIPVLMQARQRQAAYRRVWDLWEQERPAREIEERLKEQAIQAEIRARAVFKWRRCPDDWGDEFKSIRYRRSMTNSHLYEFCQWPSGELLWVEPSPDAGQVSLI